MNRPCIVTPSFNNPNSCVDACRIFSVLYGSVNGLASRTLKCWTQVSGCYVKISRERAPLATGCWQQQDRQSGCADRHAL